MIGDKAFLMSSLALILAIFFRRRPCFFLEDGTNVLTNGEDATDCGYLGNPAQQDNSNHCKLKTMWIYPWPQFWFEQLLLNWYQDCLWREHFRVTRDIFGNICGLVGPQLMAQNTILCEAITVEKWVAVAMWRLATGNSCITVGLTFGISQCTAMNVKDKFYSA